MQKDDVTEELIKDHAGKKKVPIILGITFAIIAVAIVVIVVVIQANSPQRKYRKLLDQGREFLAELKYEKAIAAIDEVLKIDPKNVDALELKAEVYVAWAKAEEKAGNHEEALRIAKEGYESTDDRKLKKLIDKLNNSGEDAEEKGTKESLGEGESFGKTEGTDPTKEPEEDAYEKYKKYLTADRLNEGVAYYQSLIQENPKDTEAYCFGAALCLVKDDAISALTVLEAGIAAGADKDVLMRQEEYVRKNAVITVSYGTLSENYDGEAEVSTDTTIYDGNGRKTKWEDTKGNTETWEYDEKGNLIYSLRTYGWGTSTNENYYQYNERGDVVYQKYESYYGDYGTGSTTEWYSEIEYDSAGRKTHVKTSSLYFVTNKYYEYDDKGNMVYDEEINVDNFVKNYYTYDENGKLLTMRTDGDVQGIGMSYYEYDARGNMTFSNEWDGETNYAYDLMDQIVEKTWNGEYGSKASYVNVYHFEGDVERVLR